MAEKKPTTLHDRSAVAVYWLNEIAKHSPITAGDVLTCYRGEGWKLPTDLANALAVTAHRKGFFDTADLQDIKLAPQGFNRVEHELPKQAKS